MAARPHAVPRLGLGDHAAADAGRDGDPVLRALHAALPRRARAGRGAARRGAAPVVRARLLRARAQPAARRAGDRGAARRRVPAGDSRRSWRCPASAARPPARSSRCRAASGTRSSTATSSACWRAGSASRAIRASRRSSAGCGRSPRRARRSERVARLHAGDHGSRRHGLHARAPRLPAVPGERRAASRARATCRTGCRRRGRVPARPAREAWLVVAMRGGHKVLLERRPPSGIWGGLWGLPEFPTRAHAVQWCSEHLVGRGARRTRAEPLRHAFSHFDYEMQAARRALPGQGRVAARRRPLPLVRRAPARRRSACPADRDAGDASHPDEESA